MQHRLFGMALAAAVLTMPAAYAQTPAGALPQLEPGQSLGLALGMKTVPNLRDVGGYGTSDGRTVARGIAFRSDIFNPMSPEEIRKLEQYGSIEKYFSEGLEMDAAGQQALRERFLG